MSGIVTMGAFTVDAGIIGAGAAFGAGLTAASLAALGISASDIAGGAGDSFYGYHGATNGFTDLSSFNNAISNGANTNTIGGNAQLSSQNIYQSTLRRCDKDWIVGVKHTWHPLGRF